MLNMITNRIAIWFDPFTQANMDGAKNATAAAAMTKGAVCEASIRLSFFKVSMIQDLLKMNKMEITMPTKCVRHFVCTHQVVRYVSH